MSETTEPEPKASAAATVLVVDDEPRVRAALAPGWDWNHKTGTGQELNGRIGGINDIGLLTAPDGSVYAMAIMTVPNSSDGGAQELMRNVAKAVMAAHQARGAAN